MKMCALFLLPKPVSQWEEKPVIVLCNNEVTCRCGIVTLNQVCSILTKVYVT